MKAAIFAISLVLLATCLQGQVGLQVGPELGYALNSLPWRQADIYPDDYRIETFIPKFNPMIGMNGSMLLGKHWILNASLQYQLTGDHYVRKVGVQWPNPSSETYILSRRYHKICLPLSFGFRFQVGKLHPFIAIGYRPGTMVYGRIKMHVQSYSASNPDDNFDVTNVFKPRDINSAWPTTTTEWSRKWMPQIMISIGTEIGEHLKASLNAAAGRIGRPTWGEKSEWERLYGNEELYATLSYRIWQKSSKPKKPKLKY